MPRLPLVLLCLGPLTALTACTGPQHPGLAGAWRFTCTPPDARIVLDEQDEGPCVLWNTRWLGVSPGVHRLQIVRASYLPFESDLVPNGRREVMQVRLRPVPD